MDLPSLGTHHKIFIFLDAMDESAEKGRPEILQLLREIVASDSSSTFKCLLTGRPLPTRELDGDEHGHVDLEEENREDIDVLITSKLESFQSHLGAPTMDFQFAYDYMLENSQGCSCGCRLYWTRLRNYFPLEPGRTGGTTSKTPAGTRRHVIFHHQAACGTTQRSHSGSG